MEQPTIDLTRDLDLPRVIVWDALIDPDLVSGWLAPAEIEPSAGGIYNLVWTHRPTYTDTFGRITLVQHPERLHVDTTNLGRLEFSLESVDGGFRETGTRLRLSIEGMDDATTVIADWTQNLDQLEELLHGRPTDWRAGARSEGHFWPSPRRQRLGPSRAEDPDDSTRGGELDSSSVNATKQLSLAPAERAIELIGTDLTEKNLRLHLEGLPGVDAVGLEQRAAGLGTRSIKTTSKAWALDTAIRLMDLTTLEGADTPGKVRSLVAKAVTPDPTDLTTPQVAAVCVYGDMVPVALEALGHSHVDADGHGIAIAAVATAFPSGRASLPVKLADTKDAVANGADEIDMVIDRGAFLAGNFGLVFDQIVAVKEACRRDDGTYAHLKVILETGELNTYDNVRRASWLAILAGGDFIKTSTGKVSPAATLPVTLLMLEVVRDWHRLTGERIGVKPAGGIRTSKDAIKYLVTVAETVGEAWLDPHLFRFGASSLLNDVLLQRQKLKTGRYSGPDYVTVD